MYPGLLFFIYLTENPGYFAKARAIPGVVKTHLSSE